MESVGPDTNQPFPSKASTPTVSRRSSAARLKPLKYRSNSSLKVSSAGGTPTTPTEEQSLTSFPSLSPAIEASPENLNANAIRPSISSTLDHSVVQQAGLLIPSAFEGLFSPISTPATSGSHSGLFDDVPSSIRNVPGTIHHQSDENIERLIARKGAVPLVKQLAQDLAERDAQITLLQRRAEERESLLRRMLRECEVSNLDIENRLRELRKARDGQDGMLNGHKPIRKSGYKTGDGFGTRPEASVGARLAEAFGDDLDTGDKDDIDDQDSTSRLRPPLIAEEDGFKTIRGPRNPSIRSADNRSLASKTSVQNQKSGAMAGLKEYLRYVAGTGDDQAKSQSQLGGSQRGNHTEDWQGQRTPSTSVKPSPPTLSRNSSQGSVSRESYPDQERKASNASSDYALSSSSVAGWVTKLVAGGSKVNGKKPRAATLGTIGAQNGTGSSTLHKMKSRTDLRSNTATRTSAGIPGNVTYNATGTVRKMVPETRKSLSNAVVPSMVDSVDESITNLGPVEMDTFLPEDARPPTLVQYNNYGSSAEFLTDRFGFIYDQRRRRRQDEAAAALPLSKRSDFVEALKKQQRTDMSTTHGVDGETVSNHSQRSRAGSLQASSRPETPASMDDQSDEQSINRWQDYLQLSNFRTELLSHTPYAAPITDITTGEFLPELPSKASQIVVSKHGNVPEKSVNPPPASTRAISENAELAQISTTGSIRPTIQSKPPPDPVKSLLDHVNDVHDVLQRDRTVKWNEFLRKVRAERRRDGELAGVSGTRSKAWAMPESQLADGEVVGVAGLGVKGKVGRAKGTEFRNLVLSGIPVALRAKIWAECSGALSLRVPGYYEEFVNSNLDDPVIAQQIQMDITRTLTDNIFFRKGQGIQKLNEVLLAYARRNPEVGYCQGMNLITANLLLIMPAAEDAFWILAAIVETILPTRYYDSSLLTSRADQIVLRQYVAEVLPQLSAHLENLSIDLEAVTFQWFLSVFTDCLSAEALFRVWDVVLCLNDGSTFLFQVALALLKLNEKSLLACESPAEVYGYINQRMTDHAISIDGLIRASEGLKKEVKRDDVAERRQQAVDAEEDMIRQRESIRKGKQKVSSDESAAPPSVTTDGTTGKLAVIGGHAVVQEIGRDRGGRLTRDSSRANIHYGGDDEYDEWGGDLQVRTPMPIDEEALWRA